MIHLLLLSYALTAVLGTASAVYASQAYRSLKFAYLRSVYAYTIVFLAAVFCGQILEYIYINILRGTFRDVPLGIITSWNIFLSVARLLMLYAVGRALLRMKELAGTRPFFAGFALTSILQLAPSAAMASALLFHVRSSSLFLRTAPLVGEFLAAALIGWLFASKAPKNGRRSIWIFGLVFTAVYAAQFAIRGALGPSPAYYANSVLLLPVSAFPFLWIKYGLLKEIWKGRPVEKPDLSGRLLRDFNISPREEEIIRLILQGKSNKEIQAQLFISHSTVKNHVYNIYQKMNVKSRLQLVSLVLAMTSSSPAAP